jgi:cobalt-zinc-cadmium resistance protein CzcA
MGTRTLAVCAVVTQTRGLLAEGHTLRDAVREASIGRVRPKLMTAGTATLGRCR